MGQKCCSSEQINAQQLPKLQVHKNDHQNITQVQLEEDARNKLEAMELKLVEQEKQEQAWLEAEEKIIEKQEQKKEQFVDFHHIIHLYQKCCHFYKGHDIDSACDTAKQIHKQKHTIMQKRSINQSDFLRILKNVEQSWQKQHSEYKIQAYQPKFFRNIQKQMQDMMFYFNAVFKEQPFVEKINEDGIKISTRRQDGIFGALIEAQLNVPFEYFAFILTEVPFYSDIFPYCESSTLLRNQARNSRIGQIIMNFPFLSRRQAYFQGSAYFRFNHTKDIFIYSRSIHDKPHLQQELNIKATLNKGYVPLDYKYFVITYQPLRQGVGKIKFAFNIDNKVNFIPEFIQEYVTKEIGKKFFKKLVQTSEEFKGSKWEKSMIDNPDLTLFIKQKMRQYLDSLRKQSRQK